MTVFNTVCLLDQIHLIGASVLYPDGFPSHVCVDLAIPGKRIGRVTYKLGELPCGKEILEEVLQAALQKFLAGQWDIQLLKDPGNYSGGIL